MKQFWVLIMLGLFCVAVGTASWKFERWINWKLDYSSRVEQRIKELEARIDRLEKR